MQEAEQAEHLTKLAERAQATFWGMLGCEIVQVDTEKATISLQADQHHMNLIDMVHGGVLMSLLDNAMGLVVVLACPGEKTVTAQMNTHFLESAKGGTLICEAEIMHRIGRTITLQGTVKDEGGKLIAWGSGSYRIMSKTVKYGD